VTVEIENRHGGAPLINKSVSYGHLEKILICKLPDNNIFQDLRGKICLLALVIPCNTNGCHATMEMTMYTTTTTSVITDLQFIKAVVGCIESRVQWSIIDRSRSIAHVAFAEDNDGEGDEIDGLSY
jgi:hypothetical protein